MRVLSLDIGSNKFGIAITDMEQKVVTPLERLVLANFDGMVFFNKLKKHLGNLWDEIETLVIGNSEDQEYLNNGLAIKCQDQIKRIFSSWTNWNIVVLPENFTSVQSYGVLKKMNYSAKRIKKNIDSYSAAILLTDYFIDSNRDLMFYY